MYTIKRVSEMVGVRVATLRAWQRRYGVVTPIRSSAGYRLYRSADIAVLRRMQALVESGWSPKEASQAAVAGEARDAARHIDLRQGELRGRSTAPPDEAAVDLVAAAASLDPVAISRLLDERFAAISFEQLIDGWLLPELERLGIAWATGQVSVAGEHMVAAAVQRERRLRCGRPRRWRNSSLADRLASRLSPRARHPQLATAARRQGIDVIHLGTDLPLSDWLSAVARQRPDAVVIAVPMPSDVAPAVELVRGVLAGQTPMAVGGQYQDEVVAAGSLGDPSAVALGHSISGGAAALRGLLVSVPT